MRKFRFNKLVRDKIPANQTADGAIVNYQQLGKQQYLEALKDKLVEEVAEFLKEKRAAEALSELADVEEVIDCLIAALGGDLATVSKLRIAKNRRSGSFKQGLYIKNVKVPDDFPTLKHFLKHPERYPEVK